MNQAVVSPWGQAPIVFNRPSGFTLWRTFVLVCAGLTLSLAVSPALKAQALPTAPSVPPRSAIEPSIEPLAPEATDRLPCTTDCIFYTDSDISQTVFTQPSLWWSVRELGERLIPDWVVYPVERRVDFTIDPQRWNWMNYFERYTLMTQLAYVLRPNNYDFQIFDPQQPDFPVASYTCEFAIAPPACQLHFAK